MASVTKCVRKTLHCQVLSCTNTSHTSSFLRFWPDNNRYKEWYKTMNPLDLAPVKGKHTYVCSKHFSLKHYTKTPTQDLENHRASPQSEIIRTKDNDEQRNNSMRDAKEEDENFEVRRNNLDENHAITRDKRKWEDLNNNSDRSAIVVVNLLKSCDSYLYRKLKKVRKIRHALKLYRKLSKCQSKVN